ncbi:MAG: hypothetical protein SOI44_10280 [Lactimicrobium sp.]|jgi:hypothetical protein|uniref:DUF7713 domain-containing protein n=1 Tax=Lactimicrobium sp. TaxID=2563780 RepID=UPI002F359AA2
MADKLCDRCKKQTAVIQLDHHYYCLDCWNHLQLDQEGLPDLVYDRQFSVYDMENEINRKFDVTAMVLDDKIEWTASEINGLYQAKIYNSMAANGADAVNDLQRTVDKIVNTHTLQKTDDPACNTICDDGKYYLVKDKGSLVISCDDDENPLFLVDGRYITPDDFANALTMYEGFRLDFRITSQTERVLGNDDYLIRKKITVDSLLEEADHVIALYCDERFLPERYIPMFSDRFHAIIEKLHVLYTDGDREDAKTAADELCVKLQQIETTNNFFPEPLPSLIQDALSYITVDPEFND